MQQLEHPKLLLWTCRFIIVCFFHFLTFVSVVSPVDPRDYTPRSESGKRRRVQLLTDNTDLHSEN